MKHKFFLALASFLGVLVAFSPIMSTTTAQAISMN